MKEETRSAVPKLLFFGCRLNSLLIPILGKGKRGTGSSSHSAFPMVVESGSPKRGAEAGYLLCSHQKMDAALQANSSPAPRLLASACCCLDLQHAIACLLCGYCVFFLSTCLLTATTFRRLQLRNGLDIT